MTGLGAAIVVTGCAQNQVAHSCLNAESADAPELRIAACAALIERPGSNAAPAYLHRGMLYAQSGDYPRAADDYDRAIRIDSKYSEAYSLRGALRFAQQDYDSAFADYGEAIRHDPRNVRALNNRCWARAALNIELEQALSDCSEAIRLRPQDPNTWDTRGLVRVRRGEFEAAISDYNTALKGDAKLASALFGRGLARLRIGQNAEGHADIDAATMLSPRLPQAFAAYRIVP
jgi:tetratricopeptide (TPR) repeat protein